jgi:hypothetical protein
MPGLGRARQGNRRGGGAGKKDQRQQQDQGACDFQKGAQHSLNLIRAVVSCQPSRAAKPRTIAASRFENQRNW